MYTFLLQFSLGDKDLINSHSILNVIIAMDCIRFITKRRITILIMYQYQLLAAHRPYNKCLAYQKCYATKMYYLFSNIILNWEHPLSIFFLYLSYPSSYVHMDWLTVVKHMISRFMRKLLVAIARNQPFLPILTNSIYLAGWTYGMALLRSLFTSDISGDDPDYKDCTFSFSYFFFCI